MPGASHIARYLAGGQMINVVKNGATSIETMILAAFAGPGVIAMYRLAKSTLGGASAAANVAFQQGFASIAKAVDAEHKKSIWGQLNRRTVRLCLLTLPVSAAFALIYGLDKPDISIVTFELITVGVFLAFLPSVLLQGPFIIVSIAGNHGAANRAYLVSLIVLLAGAVALFAMPSVWLFLGVVAASSWCRHLMLARSARALLA
jgi:O-antigen/teichoic acid export membrane protein